MEVLRYSDFSLNLQQRLLAGRVPIGGSIEVTRRCPSSCVHCYNRIPLEDPEARRQELTFEEHCGLLDELAEAGCLWLLYTGGEIFARPDFLDIYTYAKKKGFLITLFSNGTLITQEIADYLAEWRPFSIEISLYGITKETYERITRAQGSYERCMQGIYLLIQRALPLTLKSMAIVPNKHELWEMKRFAEEKLGLEFRFDAMINPCLDCSQSPLAVRLSPQEVVELDLQDPKRIEEWKKFARMFNGPVDSSEHADDLYQCWGGINSFAIDPYGLLGICVLSRNGYDLRQGSFREGWEGFISDLRHKRITKWTKCVNCEIKATCGMCPANGELESRDAEDPVDFLCQVAHLRAKALDLPIKEHGECKYCQMHERPEGLEDRPDGP
jgi:radical SAM protein with 4Fe4S-binding SPASM domain